MAIVTLRKRSNKLEEIVSEKTSISKKIVDSVYFSSKKGEYERKIKSLFKYLRGMEEDISSYYKSSSIERKIEYLEDIKKKSKGLREELDKKNLRDVTSYLVGEKVEIKKYLTTNNVKNHNDSELTILRVRNENKVAKIEEIINYFEREKEKSYFNRVLEGGKNPLKMATLFSSIVGASLTSYRLGNSISSLLNGGS